METKLTEYVWSKALRRMTSLIGTFIGEIPELRIKSSPEKGVELFLAFDAGLECDTDNEEDAWERE